MAKQKGITNEQFQWLILSIIILGVSALSFFAVETNIQMQQQARAISILNADVTRIMVKINKEDQTATAPVFVPPMMQPPIR